MTEEFGMPFDLKLDYSKCLNSSVKDRENTCLDVQKLSIVPHV